MLSLGLKDRRFTRPVLILAWRLRARAGPGLAGLAGPWQTPTSGDNRSTSALPFFQRHSATISLQGRPRVTASQRSRFRPSTGTVASAEHCTDGGVILYLYGCQTNQNPEYDTHKSPEQTCIRFDTTESITLNRFIFPQKLTESIGFKIQVS